MSIRVPAALMVVGCVAFAVGLYFPVLVLLDGEPSAMAYGVLLVSFPAWAVGALSAGGAGYVLKRSDRVAARLQKVSWLLLGLNVLAAIACAIWSPTAIS